MCIEPVIQSGGWCGGYSQLELVPPGVLRERGLGEALKPFSAGQGTKKVTGCHGYQLTVWSQTSSLTSLSLRLATKCLTLQSAGDPQAGGMTALVPHPRGLRAGGFPSQATELPPTLRSGTPNPTHTPPGFKCLSNTKFNFI